MAKDVTNTSNLSVDDISVQLAVLKDDIASLTSTMADLTKAKSAEAANQAKSTAQDLANSGRDKACSRSALLPVSALSPVCLRHAANVRICDG